MGKSNVSNFETPDGVGAADGWDRTAGLLEALSDPARLHLLRLLATGPLSGRDLATSAGMTAGTTAGHLRLLRRHGLVRWEGLRRQSHFRLADAVGTPPGTVFTFADGRVSVEVTPSLDPVVGRPEPVPTEALIRLARLARRSSAAAVARSWSVRADAQRTVRWTLALAGQLSVATQRLASASPPPDESA